MLAIGTRVKNIEPGVHSLSGKTGTIKGYSTLFSYVVWYDDPEIQAWGPEGCLHLEDEIEEIDE